MTKTSGEVRLRARPTGRPSLDIFELASVEVPSPAEGEVQVENLWMSVDPYMVNRLYEGPSYTAPFQIGKPLDGYAIGRVTSSTVGEFRPGDLVQSMYGWREVCNAKARRLTKIEERGLPPQAYLGAAGLTGMTAYIAVVHLGEARPNEVVYVSAAAGAVGSIACQIAKIRGCTVIGTAGGAAKADYLRTIGVDHVIDYKAVDNLSAALGAAAPGGIDLYVDNVGGDHLQAALTNMKNFGRIVVSGMISSYADRNRPGPSNLFEIVAHRLSIKGFLLGDYGDEVRRPFMDSIAGWIKSGAIKPQETVEHGIARAPQAFLSLLTGANLGKMLVKLI